VNGGPRIQPPLSPPLRNRCRERVVEPIPFNKPFVAGKELFYIAQAITFGNISGDGHFTKASSRLLEDRFDIRKVLLTPSCTAALEMAAMLCNLGPGDEVIMPSFTFVSTANAVVRAGARPVFVDIRPDTLNLDESLVEAAITARTKSIWLVHYAGVACEMDAIMQIAERHGLLVVEDAAQAVSSTYKGTALGSIGHLGCYSFHETKNYICGEGGALCINDPRFLDRADILRDKGTNRQKFLRGEVDKYTWVDIGSSYVPSEIASAFLFGQLELLDALRERRRALYDNYAELLEPLAVAGLLRSPILPPWTGCNHHMFYCLLPSAAARDAALEHLRQQSINAVSHYVPLHSSPFFISLGSAVPDLPVTDDLSARLLRLPMFYELTDPQQRRVVAALAEFVQELMPVPTHATQAIRAPALSQVSNVT
jgi:dTDP-4-amino-4,6-dideoxygalactose transaminase